MTPEKSHLANRAVWISRACLDSHKRLFEAAHWQSPFGSESKTSLTLYCQRKTITSQLNGHMRC